MLQANVPKIENKIENIVKSKLSQSYSDSSKNFEIYGPSWTESKNSSFPFFI